MALPTGTVTFLLTDIQGSTRLTQRLGSGWPPLLARHFEILRAAVAQEGGTEFGTEGDALFAVFESAPRAVAAAIDAQRALAREPWPGGAEIRVRMGLHTGEGSLSGDTYVGIDIVRAARIAEAGHGGQIVISASVRVLVEGTLPDGADIHDLGQHRLRDLEQPERLGQVTVQGLRSDFPELRSLDRVPNNLPSQLSSFLGREREIGEVRQLLDDHRLLTLTGPGGTGKTRLSVQVALRSLGAFPDGVYFVPLAAIRDPELFAPAVAAALGLPDRGGAAPMAHLVEHLGDRHVLLVLDNFEQVLTAAPVVSELLSGAPRLNVIVTSRSRLGIYGEREYPVAPLQVPDPAHLPSLTVLSQYEAVALFIDRARAVKPDFAVDNENAPFVAEICARLDGLPLAIELAAARINVLTPQAILERLDQGLGLLSRGGRDRPARQQTLRGAIAWSYDLLEEEEQGIFCSLGVFVGASPLDAIEAVLNDEGRVDILETVTSLVEKSLLRRTAFADGTPAFRMLETIREYAVERLNEASAWDALADRHAAYYVDRAAEIGAVVMGSDKRAVLDRVEEDHDNMRAALEWLLQRKASAQAMRVVAGLWRFWQMRGYLAEASAVARRVLQLPGVEDHPQELADALEAAGGLAWWRGDLPETIEYYERCLEVRRRLGDRSRIAEALYNLSFPLFPANESSGDLTRARALVSEALELWEAEGDELGRGKAHWAMGNINWTAGDFDASRAEFEAALPIFQEHGDTFLTGWSLYDLGLISVRRDELDRGRQELLGAVRIFADAGDVSGYTLVLDACAALALRAGDRQLAARISGGVAILERQTGTGLNPVNREMVAFDPEHLREDPATADAWAEGARMGAQEIVAHVLERLDPLPDDAAPPKLRA